MAVAVMKDTIRLDKYLTEMGEGTRSQIKEMARKGRISVNGVTEKKSERKISPSSDTVAVDGRNVSYVEYEYYMLHKPQGVVSATEDRLHETVVDLITDRKRDDLFPVGRLDIDTEGLLLLTNDGDLTHRMLSPKRARGQGLLRQNRGNASRRRERPYGGGTGSLRRNGNASC